VELAKVRCRDSARMFLDYLEELSERARRFVRE